MPDKPSPQRAVVLVVEDEALVRMFAVDVLEEAGFEVIEAENGDVALTTLRARPEVQVLFTDVDMPGSIDGFELARITAREHPEIRIVVVSGKAAPGPGDLAPGAQFIAKPYAPAKVVRAIHGVP